MQFKLQLSNNSGDDPKYWNKFRQEIFENVNGYPQMIDNESDMINEVLIEYRAVYVIEDDGKYSWNDYVLFVSEADHFLFMLRWS